MARRLTQVVSADVLAFWRQRIAITREKLTASPNDEFAGLWIIQYQIAAYLLGRYGGEQADPLPESLTGERPKPRVVQAPQDAVPPSEADPMAVPPGMGKAPRAAASLRGQLRQIADTNRERYAEFERQAQEQRLEILESTKRQAARLRRLFALRYGAQSADPGQQGAPDRSPTPLLTLESSFEELCAYLNYDEIDFHGLCEAFRNIDLAERQAAAPDDEIVQWLRDAPDKDSGASAPSRHTDDSR